MKAPTLPQPGLLLGSILRLPRRQSQQRWLGLQCQALQQGGGRHLRQTAGLHPPLLPCLHVRASKR